MPTDHQQAAFVAVAVLVAVAALADCLDDLEDLPPANQGAFEGGPTGTFRDAGINNVIQEGDQTGPVPAYSLTPCNRSKIPKMRSVCLDAIPMPLSRNAKVQEPFWRLDVMSISGDL